MTIELLVKIKNELEEDFGRNCMDKGMDEAIKWAETVLICPSGLLQDLLGEIPNYEAEDYDDVIQTFIGCLVSSHLLSIIHTVEHDDTKGQYYFNFDLPVNDYHIGFAMGWTKNEAQIAIWTSVAICFLVVLYLFV